jgi:hypothetical protein
MAFGGGDLAMDNNRETCNLVRALLLASGLHVARHITNQRNRLAYARAMSRCQHICSEHVSGNDLLLMKQRLITLKYDASKRLKKRWFSREDHYYTMSMDHAVEIIDSILVRFVNGYSNEGKSLAIDLIEGSDNGHQICACLDCFGKVKN